jgi:metal transporter CNNM
MESTESSHLFLWLGIVFCISQSAMFSGLNLAFFSIPRLRLEIEAANNNRAAIKVLSLRENSNFLLSTILWGNVGINVLLTLISNSVMAGIAAFVFSTFLITFLGEIIPQAYFSRNALKMASGLSPLLRFYQILLYPVAKPSALLLNWMVGQESIHYFKEKSLEKLIHRHMEEEGADEIGYVEGVGAINFLTLDDIAVTEEGEVLHPESIILLAHRNGIPVFPEESQQEFDPFLKKINRSGEKWVVFVDQDGNPSLVMDADGFLRAASFKQKEYAITDFCHTPLIVRDTSKTLGEVLQLLEIQPVSKHDDVIDRDIILLWSQKKQIITGADILGRLLRGIVPHKK